MLLFRPRWLGQDEKWSRLNRHPRFRLKHRRDAKPATPRHHRRCSATAGNVVVAAAAAVTDGTNDVDASTQPSHNDDDNQSHSSPDSINHAKRTYRVIRLKRNNQIEGKVVVNGGQKHLALAASIFFSHLKKLSVFRCVLASLQEGMSVRWSVRPSHTS